MKGLEKNIKISGYILFFLSWTFLSGCQVKDSGGCRISKRGFATVLWIEHQHKAPRGPRINYELIELLLVHAHNTRPGGVQILSLSFSLQELYRFIGGAVNYGAFDMSVVLAEAFIFVWVVVRICLWCGCVRM